MKKLHIAIVLTLTVLSGCAAPDKNFVDRMDAPAQLLFPDLRKAYAGQPLGYDDAQIKRRLMLLDEWEKTIKAAKEAQK
jgi:hypothetical protein